MSKKMRYCYVCGEEMGMVEDRYYDRRDTCGQLSCQREVMAEEREEREEAHERLDRDMGW